MKQSLVSLLVGFIFAIGLGISGMVQPHKVMGFLDLFGNWDPSLLFVMIGAISVHFVIYKLIKNRPAPLLHTDWQIPTKKDITPSLLLGSLLFGIGWALAGYCPGPALTSLATFEIKPLVFVISMIMGMYLFSFINKYISIKR